MLYDERWGIWLTLGWRQPKLFAQDLRKYGMLVDQEDVMHGLAVIDGDNFRILKKPLNAYRMALSGEPTQITYYRT